MRYRTLALTMLILSIFPAWVAAQPAANEIEGGTIVASGFNGPQGIGMDAEGDLCGDQSGLGGDKAIQYISMETGKPTPTKMGTSARIVMIYPDGEQTEVAALPSLAASPMEMVGGARLTWLDGALYATSGVWMGGVGDAPDRMGTVVRVENGGKSPKWLTYGRMKRLITWMA